MQMPKELREKPFDKYSGPKNDKIRYKINAFTKIIEHERIYIVELISNPKYQRNVWRTENLDKSLRIIISKKQKDYAVFFEGSTRSCRPALRSSIYTWDYVDWGESMPVLQKLLGIKSVYLSTLSELLEEYRIEQRQKRKENSHCIDDSVVYECPTEYTRGFLEFIRNEVIAKDSTLIYKRGGLSGTCAHCGKKVYATWAMTKFKQYMIINCPVCGETVQCILEGSAAWKADYVQNVISMERKGDRIWFRQFHILRDYSAKYEKLENYLDEIARYVIIGGKSAAWRNEAKEQSFMNHPIYKLHDWCRYNNADVYDGYYKFYCANIAETVKDTALQYAALDEYIKLEERDEVKYCRWFLKYPVFEFLIKKGMGRVVSDKLFHRDGISENNAILWQRKKLKECFKFPLRLLNLLPPEKWNIEKLRDCYKLYKKCFNDSEIQKSLILGVPIDETAEIAKYMTVSKLCDYMQKQNAGKYHVGYRDYADYLADCEKLGFDMKSKSVLFPKNLYSAHQRTIAMIHHQKNKILDADILKAYKKHQKKSFEEDGLIIRPAKSSLELIKEGQALHHCVGGYAEKMARGETMIFFVRDAEKKTKPYFTLEYKDGAVVQCRTLNNRSYETEEKVKVFVEHWLKKMKKGA